MPQTSNSSWIFIVAVYFFIFSSFFISLSYNRLFHSVSSGSRFNSLSYSMFF